MKQKLNAKDFILIGVLTALMWIICMIISTIMSVAGPVTNVFYPSVVAIPNGIVMMLLLAKVPKKGVFTICAAIQEAERCREEGVGRTILFNLTGTGYFDLAAFQQYNTGAMVDLSPTEAELIQNFRGLEACAQGPHSY